MKKPLKIIVTVTSSDEAFAIRSAAAWFGMTVEEYLNNEVHELARHNADQLNGIFPKVPAPNPA